MKRVKLGDVVEFQRGYDLPHASVVPGPYPVMASTSIFAYHNEYKAEDGIVIGRSGTVGRPQLVRGKFWPHNTTLFTTDIKGNNLEYLFYCLVNLDVGKMKTGSNIPTLNRNDLYPLEIPFETDVSVQKRIATVLNTIDAKIENNNVVAAELESMAKLLYDYWFVQFDFPDENGKPYKSSGGKMVWNEDLKREIPEGWAVAQLGDHISTNRGISYSSATLTDDGVPMINLASFNVDSTYKVSGIKTYSGSYGKEQILKPYDLVMCNTQQTAIDPTKDIIGKTLLVPDIFDGDIVSSHHVTTIRTDNNAFKYYLNAESKTEWFHKYVAGFASGTNILGLDFNGVLNYRMPIPPQKLLNRFAELIHTYEAKKNESIKENTELASLRDFLIPLLLNGQVTFKEADCH